MTCTGPACTHPARYSKLCDAHLAQQRRHPDRPLKPLRGPTAMVRVTFRCPAELREAVELRARAAGLDPAELWRRAGQLLISKKPA